MAKKSVQVGTSHPPWNPQDFLSSQGAKNYNDQNPNLTLLRHREDPSLQRYPNTSHESGRLSLLLRLLQPVVMEAQGTITGLPVMNPEKP